MKSIPKCLSVLGLALVPAIALTQETSGNPTGPYVGAGVGRFSLHLNSFDDVGTAVNSISHSSDNAWKVFAGYRFIPYLGIEAAYIDFGHPSDRFVATGSNGNYDVKMSGFAASVIGRVPVGPIELFAKAGEYYYNVDTRIDFDAPGPDLRSSHSRSDFLWGGGLSIVVLRHLELRGEYERIEIRNSSDTNALWLTAAWRF